MGTRTCYFWDLEWVQGQTDLILGDLGCVKGHTDMLLGGVKWLRSHTDLLLRGIRVGKGSHGLFFLGNCGG